MAKKQKQHNKWYYVMWTLFMLVIAAYIMASFVSVFLDEKTYTSGNVVVIPIRGTILVDSGTGLLGESYASSSGIIKNIKQADHDPEVKAIVFEINSPGGSGVASEDIVNAIKRTNKTTIALIKEVGTSGAYWVASASDKIYASRMSVVGSVGVFSSYLEFSGLMEKYGINYQRLVGGEYKDIGAPMKELTEEEYKILKSHIDQIHNFFIIEVAENRKLNNYQKQEISSALFYTGAKGMDLGLVDEIGDIEDIRGYLEQTLGIEDVEFSKYIEEVSLLELFSRMVSKQSYNLGRGIASFMFEKNNLKIMT